MGFLDNVTNKAVPEGSGLAKPLILAFTALLASGVLGRKQEPTPAPGTSPASHPDAGGLLVQTSPNTSAQSVGRRPLY